MRIVAGRWRGRALMAPEGLATRPTSDRARQALFDSLWHAPWAGRGSIEGATVLDAFAGSGALGFEALSRGAARAVFLDSSRAAVTAIRRNASALGAGDAVSVLAADALAPPRGEACGLVFLDPPYGKGLVSLALAALAARGWIAPGALIVAETGSAEAVPHDSPLAARTHGAARITIWRSEA
jgi:16S rRNA (guanine966-N2)-methyltransferase